MSRNTRIKLKTKRLILPPVSDAEPDSLIADAADEGLKLAYTEMKNAAQNDPDNRVWYVPWIARLKKENTAVCYLGFHGPAADDAVEPDYGAADGFEGKGYTLESANALSLRALGTEGVLFVEAEAEESNAASRHILEKLGFIEYGRGEEGVRYVREKALSGRVPIGLCFGMSIGMLLGSALLDSTASGICIGIFVGICIGLALDKKTKSRLDAAHERRRRRLGQ